MDGLGLVEVTIQTINFDKAKDVGGVHKVALSVHLSLPKSFAIKLADAGYGRIHNQTKKERSEKQR